MADNRQTVPTLLGHSVGHWDGEALVVETSGIKGNVVFGFRMDGFLHSDQLRVVERYTRSNDGKTLTLAATLEDPWSLREPVALGSREHDCPV